METRTEKYSHHTELQQRVWLPSIQHGFSNTLSKVRDACTVPCWEGPGPVLECVSFTEATSSPGNGSKLFGPADYGWPKHRTSEELLHL